MVLPGTARINSCSFETLFLSNSGLLSFRDNASITFVGGNSQPYLDPCLLKSVDICVFVVDVEFANKVECDA